MSWHQLPSPFPWWVTWFAQHLQPLVLMGGQWLGRQDKKSEKRARLWLTYSKASPVSVSVTWRRSKKNMYSSTSKPTTLASCALSANASLKVSCLMHQVYKGKSCAANCILIRINCDPSWSHRVANFPLMHVAVSPYSSSLEWTRWAIPSTLLDMRQHSTQCWYKL